MEYEKIVKLNIQFYNYYLIIIYINIRVSKLFIDLKYDEMFHSQINN